MSVFKEYEKHVERAQTRRSAGTVECQFRPTTKYGETIFAKYIAAREGSEDISVFRKLVNLVSNLNEANYEAAGFNPRLEISEYEVEEKGYATFKNRVVANFSEQYQLSPHDFKVTLGEFVLHPKVKELGFDDIPDLRKGVK